ncbi:MAG: hypothetical protein KIS96_01225 [Bauldia sp.]|nr:hypothetical protein [Bauldia sp.]
MTKKRVIIHIGFHKTGSSALQTFFSENVDALLAAGIDYPYPEPESVVSVGSCSGNVVQVLYRDGFMSGFQRTREQGWQRISPAFARRLVEVVKASEKDVVLLSAEMLANAPQESLAELVAGFSDDDLTFVCFVRDPFDFAYSCWRQQAKDGVRKKLLADYIRWAFEDRRILSMFKAFPRFKALGVPLVVVRYESHRANVAKAFFEATGLADTFGQAPIAIPREANRSLTGSEALMATTLAAHMRPDFVATFIRSALARTHREEAPFYDREMHQILLDRFESVIAQINEYLPEADRLVTKTRPGPNIPLSIGRAEVELHLDLLKKHPPPSRALRLKSALHPLVERLRRAVGQSSRLPPDFDGAAYLFHNPDVAEAMVDPGRHYLDTGHAEDRRYRFH